MAPDHHHIHMVGRYRQGQHADMTSRSQGQSQGHQGHFRFLPILRVSLISFDSHQAEKKKTFVSWAKCLKIF